MLDWSILLKTRQQSWRIWWPFATISLMLLLAQSIGGAWEGAIPRVWGWLLVNLLPGAVLLTGSLVLNRTPQKMIPIAVHRAVVGATAIYGILILISLVGNQAFGAEQLSRIVKLERSYWWLLPFQIVLLITYYIAFYRKETVFKANAENLRNAALKSASEAAKKGFLHQEQIRLALAEADFTQVFEKMNTWFKEKNPSELNELILIQSRYAVLCNDRDRGMLEPGQIQVQINQITAALLNLTERIND